MPNTTARTPSKLDPSPAWTVLTDAPLKGMALAREAGAVFAWDEGDQLYRINGRGEFDSVARAPGRILGAAMSDDGSLVALLGEGSRLWLMDGAFELIHDRSAISDGLSIAVDPHGRYVAVGSRMNVVQFYNRHARQAGKFETRQPLSSMVFVPDRPFLIGIGANGAITGFALANRGVNGTSLDGAIAWNEALMSGVGRLATTGDGEMILIACYTHGVQRFDLEGRAEGAYHLGGSPAQAVPDFAGRMIAVTTLEGELAILSGAGNVRWRTTLNRPAIALEADALGRYVVYGQATGEIVRLDLQPSNRPSSTRAPAPVAHGSNLKGNSASVRRPDWSADVVPHEDQAEFAVLAVSDDPPRIGVISPKNRLELFGIDGKRLGQTPEIDGVGRILRTSPGWMASATDRRLMLCDLRKNLAQRVDISLTELTHLVIRPESYGLALVQERDRIGRATNAGRWIWKKELDSSVEEMAIDDDGYTAATTEDGRLRIFDPAGDDVGEFRGPPSDPALLAQSPAGSTVSWLTLARRAQVLRGHDRLGKVVWETPVPWEAWQFQMVGPIAVITAPDGRSISYDASGHALAHGRADGPSDAFYPGPDGQPLRVARQGVHLICTDLGGRVAWRAVADSALGPVAAGRIGVAAMIGKSLAWFGGVRP